MHEHALQEASRPVPLTGVRHDVLGDPAHPRCRHVCVHGSHYLTGFYHGLPFRERCLESQMHASCSDRSNAAEAGEV